MLDGLFRVQSNKVIDQTNCLESTAAMVDLIEERRHLFKSCPLHTWGGKLQGLPCNWAMPNTTLNEEILMWHMGLQEMKVPALNLLQTCHFSHLKLRGQKFKDLYNLMALVEIEAMVKGTWSDNWDKASLIAMAGSMKPLFDFDTVANTAKRKRKR
eukprot:1809623-Ditylum_brightwellii.AAC.1